MSATENNTRLTRDKEAGMIAGVCAGIAARYGLVRVVAVLLTVVSLGAGVLIIYVAAWILIPAAGAAESPSMGDRRREFTGEVATAADRATEAAKIAAGTQQP